MLHKSQNDKKVSVSTCSVWATEDFIAQSPSEICVRNCRNLQKYRFYQLYLIILEYVVSLDEFDMSRNGIKHRNICDFLLAEEWN